jgi:hypothetical protein
MRTLISPINKIDRHDRVFYFRLSILLIFVEEMEMGKIIIKVLTNKLMFPYKKNTTIREVRIYD